MERGGTMMFMKCFEENNCVDKFFLHLHAQKPIYTIGNHKIHK